MLNCQKPPPPEPTTGTGKGKKETKKREEEERIALNGSQLMARDATLTCPDGDCDPSVGLLSVVLKDKDEWNAGQCTASLVGPDTVVTNAHCLPPDLEAAGSGCKNRIWLTFGSDPSHPEYEKQARCAKVLFHRRVLGTHGVDYAYLQLERPLKRPFLRFSREGFENGRQYSLHKVNPTNTPGRIGGTLEKARCLSLHESAIFQAPLDRFSSTSFFVDCRVIEGNSGSPILADDGSIRGVAHSYVKKDLVRAALARNGSRLPEERKMADLNMGSNFACLRGPGASTEEGLPSACKDSRERMAQRRASVERERVESLKDTARRMAEDKEGEQPKLAALAWSLQLAYGDNQGFYGIGVPDCVKKDSAAPLLGRSQSIRRPLFLVRADYDRYLRPSNFGLAWGGFSKWTESLLLGQDKADAYSVQISDPAGLRPGIQSRLGPCS